MTGLCSGCAGDTLDPLKMATSPPSKVRPSRLWYWVGGAVGLLAAVGAILVFTGGDEDLGDLTDVLGTLEDLEVPGEVTVDLPADEEWAIYSPGGGLRCAVTGPAGDVDLDSDLGFGYVSLGDTTYRTAYTFDVPQAGQYEVRCAPGGARGPGEVLVGESIEVGEIAGFFGRAAVGIAILLAGALATLAIVLPVALSRARKLRDLRRGSGIGVG
jgi:hypothetical protein